MSPILSAIFLVFIVMVGIGQMVTLLLVVRIIKESQEMMSAQHQRNLQNLRENCR